MKKELLLLAGLLTGTGIATGRQKLPNIVFILADDMGYGDISYLGGSTSKIKTAHLDRMASEGAVFTDAHSSSSVSTPTRYGILTGRYNWRSELKSGVLNGYSKALIAPGRETMASMLKKEGYATAGIGKWHLGWDWNNIEKGIKNIDYSQPVANGPTTRGFDYYYGFCGSLDMPPYVYIENDRPTSLPNRTTVNTDRYDWWRKGPTAADFEHEQVLPNLIDRACQYIGEKAKADQPYFLYLPLPAPHTPILPTAEYRGKTGMGPYADFVFMVDDMVGKVLAAIDRTGEGDNTIVVFTTDNGCSPQADIPALKKLGHSPNSIFRGHKADLFDGGHRIPCLVRWPRRVKPHHVDQTICLTDFYATFADIAGHRMADTEGEDSYSLLPVLKSTRKKRPIREATVHHSINGQFTIRQGKWKLLLSASSGGWSQPRPDNAKALTGLPPVQLYDMEADPSETRNVQAEHPEVVGRLRELLMKYIRNGRSTPGEPQQNDGPEVWPQLKQMGYTKQAE